MCRSCTKLVETIGNEENPVDKGTISRPFDFKVAEQTVCSEEGEAFFDYVCVSESVPVQCYLPGSSGLLGG